MTRAKATIDHDTIKQWVESRGGRPAHVKASGSNGDPGILRIDYPGFTGKHSLEKISWKTFFDAFEDNQLALLYQDQDDSRFSKLVSRDSVEIEAPGQSARGKSSRKASTGKGGRAKTKSQKPARRSKTAVDAIELLTTQHREVEDLFEKLESARTAAQKEKLFEKLANALAAHTKIEESIFYPAAFNEQTEDELREAVEEHLVAKRLLADLLKMEYSDPQFMSKLAVLKEVVLHHVEEEENELFVRVRDDELDDLDFLGRKMQELYQRLMKEQPSKNIPKETRAAVVQF